MCAHRSRMILEINTTVLNTCMRLYRPLYYTHLYNHKHTLHIGLHTRTHTEKDRYTHTHTHTERHKHMKAYTHKQIHTQTHRYSQDHTCIQLPIDVNTFDVFNFFIQKRVLKVFNFRTLFYFPVANISYLLNLLN